METIEPLKPSQDGEIVGALIADLNTNFGVNLDLTPSMVR
jgi:hypothetical protein